MPDMPPSDKPVRQEVLEEAISLTCGDRNKDYGDPRPNFEDTAAMWSAYKGVEFSAHDVAAMMILLKVARLKGSPHKRDNWTDAAGYAGLGAEVCPTEEPYEFDKVSLGERETMRKRMQQLDATAITWQPEPEK